MSIKVLFIATHRPGRAPSQRFRFEQYLPLCKQFGIEYTFSYLFTAKQDLIFYGKGRIIKKALILGACFFKRLKDIISISQFDVVYVQREAMIFGPPVFEWIISKTKTKLIFDFDDSIWLSNVSENNKYFGWLKFPDKTSRIIKMADLIYAGNQFLSEYAKQFNKNVTIIPTTIDTKLYNLKTKMELNNERVCIGWSGSVTTIQHFKLLEPVLLKLKLKYPNSIYFKVIGDEKYVNEALDVKGLKWERSSELKDLSEIEIGLMPLPNDNWAKGKCGLKGLQYMALGIATVMSPVGVNSAIIKDGENGFLADTEDEWYNKIVRLVNDRWLNKEIGKKGRITVEKYYSVESQKQNFFKGFFNN